MTEVQVRSKLTEFMAKKDVSLSARLDLFGRWLEHEIGLVLRHHSPLFWLFVLRHQSLPRVTRDNVLAQMLYRMVLRNIFLAMKHGNSDISDMDVTDDEFGPKPEFRSELERSFHSVSPLLSQAMMLVDDLHFAAAHGGDIVPDEKHGWISKYPDDVSQSIELSGNRYTKYAYSIAGKGIALPALQMVGTFESVLYSDFPLISYAIYAIDYLHHDLPPTPTGTPANFIRKMKLLKSIYDQLESFRSNLAESSGLQFDDVRFGLLAFHDVPRRLLDEGEDTAQHLGLVWARTSRFKHDLAESLRRIHEPSADICDQFYEWLLYKNRDFNGTDVFTPYIARCAFEYNGFTFIDLAATDLPLRGAIERMGMTGLPGAIKGKEFEEYVVKKLRGAGLADFPIEPSLPLRRGGEQKDYAEFDVYFRRGEFLFLVECKARCYNHNYLREEPAAVAERLEMVKGWLRKSYERARLVASEPKGDNYCIPEGVTHVVPVVCSTFPEFIHPLDDGNMLRPNVPRICTVTELIQFALSFEATELRSKPFCIPIKA